MRKKHELTQNQKRWLAGLGIAAFFLLTAWVCYYAGKPLIQFVQEPERFRAWVEDRGATAPILFIGMVVLQVIVAVIPGEPLEIAAGYAFGALEGTLLCLAGTLIGGMIVFLLVRRFGTRAIEIFIPLENLRSLQFLQKSERHLYFWVFLIFFLPGTPKDLMCYFVGLTKLPLKSWIVISLVARLPSLITSTVGGNALGTERYLFAVIVFAATLLISALGVMIYRKITQSHEPNQL